MTPAIPRTPPPDSHTGDPSAPYRCQELRADADRVITGRASKELVERYELHRHGCPSCRRFHEVMLQAYTPAREPGRRSERDLEREFAGIRQRIVEREQSRTRVRAAGTLAAAAGVVLALGLSMRGGVDSPQTTEEIVLEEGAAPRYPDASTLIPDRVGAFGHRAQAFGRVVAGSAELVDHAGRPAAPQSFRPGTHFRVDGADAQLAVFGRVLINLQEGTLAQWTRAEHDLIEFSLQRGRLAVRFDREPSDPILQIRTPDALVRVVGTVFTVEVDEQGHTFVAVLRGQVEVLHPGTGARLATVDAGYLFDVAHTTFADVGRPEVGAALPLADPVQALSGSVPERWIVPGLPESAEQRTLERVPDPRSSESAPPRPPRRRAKAMPPSSDESAALIRELVAQAERDRRHKVQAALERCRALYLEAETRPQSPRCFDAFMREYASEPEALEGILLIGILRMDYAHDYQAAERRFQTFLRLAPHHPKAELAMYKLTLAAIESGQIAKGVQRGQAYLDRYPNGRYVGHILQRFPELRDQL